MIKGKHIFAVVLLNNWCILISMMTKLEHTIKRLWLANKAYHLASCKNGTDASDYATESTNSYLQYIINMTTGDTPYNWGDPVYVIENQIRIIMGLIECYDKPVIRDKVTAKTRWTV